MDELKNAVHALTVDQEKNEVEWTNSLTNLFKDVLHLAFKEFPCHCLFGV